jgi:hypothetical protein
MIRQIKPLLLLALCAVSIAPVVSQEKRVESTPPIHNGIWWQKQSKPYHDGFIVGYKSGSTHTLGRKTDLVLLPAAELVDGLDVFYRDFRNRNILVDDGLVYVQHELTGSTDTALKAEVSRLRANAAPSTDEP